MPAPSITLIAPSRFVEDKVLTDISKRCRAHGLAITISQNCHLRDHQFAGTDEQRADAFIREWNDGPSDILWCVRGGYGSGRLLHLLQNKLEPREKTLIGYSDQTFLLSHVSKNKLGRAVHGPMPGDVLNPEKHEALDSLLNAIKRNELSVSIEFLIDPEICCLHNGQASGRIILGNLSILTRLIGTAVEPDWDGAILIVEDVGEYLYAIDRMFLHLAMAGVLAKIGGLCLGSFTGNQDNDIPFGSTVEQIALDHLGERDIPVVSGLPFGHGPRNQPIVFGAEAELMVSSESGFLKSAS